MPCGRLPRAGSASDSCRPESLQGAGIPRDDCRILTSGFVFVDAQGVVCLMFQVLSLDADDLLQMVKHMLQGA